ncbi:hypothetical protein L6452_04159 [Arctium lappa]|uniref:Uncharacterized protein n=1 Tax=Arctium lappa TaxID=4217 RepID=A0ACB9FPV9_ARCLA|nr:hypothetical protein L6452_04159 [Arctium lappa]
MVKLTLLFLDEPTAFGLILQRFEESSNCLKDTGEATKGCSSSLLCSGLLAMKGCSTSLSCSGCFFSSFCNGFHIPQRKSNTEKERASDMYKLNATFMARSHNE